MFCVLYFSALLFWFFQSTNLFVAYYSDKFNSTEKGPAQLILSLYHIPIVIYSYILLFLLCSQNTVGRGIAECTAWLHRNRLCHHIFLIIRCADALTSVRIHQKCLTKATGHAEQMFQLNLLQIWIRCWHNDEIPKTSLPVT